MTLLSVVLALALTVVLAACGSDEPSGVTGPDRTASTPTETPASPAPTPSTTGSGGAPTATAAPRTTATRPPLPTIGPTSAETDREALVAFYNTTNGENWRILNESVNWLSDAPLGEWYGVTTNDDGRVTELQPNFYGLSGEIPAELSLAFNMVNRYIANPGLRSVITDLIEPSAEPLSVVESYFAADGTGFSTCRFDRWFEEK